MSANASDLLAAALHGDPQSLGQLLASYNDYLTLIVRAQIGRQLQGKVDAADVVQETFLDAHRQFSNFRGSTEAEFTAWLRRIMAGQLALVMRQFLGTQARDVTLERDLEGELDEGSQAWAASVLAPGSSPSQHAQRRELAIRLADALKLIPPSYREVIILRHVEGLPFADVAARMERSEDSVQKLWVRALSQLQRQLHEEDAP